ncbi:MAG: hypothetical protein IPJ75_08840 [Ignavibacteriales bacterium]|nr:hypothetical protein [Ignavibacteriales bacterium]
MKKTVYLLFLAIALLSLFTGCDAPRNNPVDPDNTISRLPRIEGEVISSGSSGAPLSFARITFVPTSSFTFSGEDGKFSLPVTKKTNGLLLIEKFGFKTDSIFVDWNNADNIQLRRSLLKFPLPVKLSIVSNTLNRFPDLKFYSFLVAVELAESNEFIDSIIVESRVKKIKFKLDKQPGDRNFEKELFSFQIEGLTSPFSIVDEVFDPVFYLSGGVTFSPGPISVTRVIDQEVKFLSPANGTIVGSSFRLLWEKFSPGWDHSYSVEIYLNDLTPILVLQKEKIDKNETGVNINQELPPGDYFWVVYSKDSFGNSTRSKPASFSVR